MKMVSYAQNGEDVMLSRALRDVAHGFYIDVGAADPTEHSVTRTFYDRGWTGLNVEPTERFSTALAAARPHDVNIRAALDETEGEEVFFAFEGTGLSTLDPDVAAGHRPGGWPMTRIVTPTRTLAALCAAYAPPTIHFLKVDVEGAEARVLRGADFTRFRPWIVVVEATHPMSPDPDYAVWEPILTGADYEFVWFDGLNRFYLAAERADALRRHFAVPVNYFDEYDLHSPPAERLAAEAGSLRDRLDVAEAAVRHLRARVDGAETEAATARAAATAAQVLAATAEAASVASRGELVQLRHRADGLYQQVLDGLARETVGQAERDALLAREQARAEPAPAPPPAPAPVAVPMPAPAPALVPSPVPSGSAARRLALGLYRALLRPVVRPVMWRTRSFLLAGLREDQREVQLRLHEEQRLLLGEVLARVAQASAHAAEHVTAHAVQGYALSERRTELAVQRLEAATAPLHALLDKPDPDFSGLLGAMEGALMTLAVTAQAGRSEADGAAPVRPTGL